MSTDPSLLRRLFELTRADLDTAIFPMPNVAAELASTEAVRLVRLSRFWRGEPEAHDLLGSTETILKALLAQKSRFALVLRGNLHDVEVWIGAGKSQYDRAAIASLVQGALPDCRLEQTKALDLGGSRYQLAAAFAGIPSLLVSGERHLSQVDSAVRGLAGRNWMFLVLATPVPRPVVVQKVNELVAEIRDVKATRLLEQSPLGGTDRAAERLCQLLESKMERFEAGRKEGMWSPQIGFFAEDSATLAVGRGLFLGAFNGGGSASNVFRVCDCAPAASAAPEPELLTTPELAIISRVPQEERSGFEVVEHARYGVEAGSAPRHPDAIVLGEILDRGCPTGKDFRIDREELTRHTLVVGVTGSGKTTTCISILKQVWREGRGAPFLVLESSKAEYRRLLGSPDFPGLRVFTVGDETVAPLRLNPFEVPQGILVQSHIDYLKSLFAAAFVLYPPMPYVLERSISEIYEDRGWDLSSNLNRRGGSPRAFPTLSDLALKVGAVVERLGYDARITMDVKAGLLARINQLRLGGGKGRMLDCRSSTPDAELFGSPCIFELRTLVSDDEKAFLMGLVLIRLFEHCESTRSSDGRLEHLTLIEEAHRLLRRAPEDRGPDQANPRGLGVEVFANLLSEVRAYGEGIVIAEQIPTKLFHDAIKNTGTKVVHRLVARDDRELIGESMVLEDSQKRGLALLGPGEAVVFSERLRKPVLAQMRRAAASDRPVSSGSAAVVAAFREQPTSNGCLGCKGKLEGCSRGRVPEEAEALVPSFRKLVNALRLEPSGARKRLDSLIQVRRAIPTRGVSPLPCLLAAMGERECEGRGSFHGWPFLLVDAAIEALVSDLNLLIAGASSGWRFAETSRRMEAGVEPPFVGCDHCRRKCSYRFDFVRGTDNDRVFDGAFMNAATPFEDLVSICRGAAEQSISSGLDDSISREAAFCFGVGRFHHLGLSSSNRADLTEKLARSLALLSLTGREDQEVDPVE